MNMMKNKKVKIIAAIVSVVYIIALWSNTGVISAYSDKPLELLLPMVIVFFAVILSRKVFQKKQ